MLGDNNVEAQDVYSNVDEYNGTHAEQCRLTILADGKFLVDNGMQSASSDFTRTYVARFVGAVVDTYKNIIASETTYILNANIIIIILFAKYRITMMNK